MGRTCSSEGKRNAKSKFGTYLEDQRSDQGIVLKWIFMKRFSGFKFN
jgi:hypothetical protein